VEAPADLVQPAGIRPLDGHLQTRLTSAMPSVDGSRQAPLNRCLSKPVTPPKVRWQTLQCAWAGVGVLQVALLHTKTLRRLVIDGLAALGACPDTYRGGEGNLRATPREFTLWRRDGRPVWMVW
jgi:hypothetical protein